MATIGRLPVTASPAAKATAWASAMPTSKNRSGRASRSRFRPVPEAMAAVMPTTRSSARASSTTASPNARVKVVGPSGSRLLPVSTENLGVP